MVNENDNIHLDVYFDYIWPYVYNAAVWLQKVQKERNNELTINWKYFSLEQINSQHGPLWKIWEQPEECPSRSLRAFWAAEAARQQGESIFHSFHNALLKAKHEKQRDIVDTNTIIEVANKTGLEMKQFKNDLSNRRLLSKLAEDHTFAVEKLGVFGTPTLVFPERQVIFLKMSSPPLPKECLPIFSELFNLAYHRRIIHEIKRPQVWVQNVAIASEGDLIPGNWFLF